MEAPSGDSGGGQPRSAPGSQPQALQKPGTSGVQHSKCAESKGLPPGSSKRQWSAGGTPEGGQAKRPKQVGRLSYARVAREGIWVAVVCENYLESQISKEKSSPKSGSPPGWLIPTGPKVWLSWSTMMNRPRTGWLQGTYSCSLGGLQAQVSGSGCSSHLQEGGGLVSGP